MEKDLLDQIIAVLSPAMDDQEERKELVMNALHGTPILQRIKWTETAWTFTRQLVRRLNDYGTLPNGQLAIAAVLLEIRPEVSLDQQAQIDAILQRLLQLSAKKHAQPPAPIPPIAPSAINLAEDVQPVTHHKRNKLTINIDNVQFERDDFKPPPAPSAPLSAPTASTPQFSFRLEGQKTQGDRVQCATETDLVFDYSHLADKLLATVQGEKLELARLESGALGMSIIPKGFTIRDGKWHQTAKFQNGELVEPVRFLLKAADTPLEEAGIHITIDKEGAVVYELQLPLQLVTAANLSALSPRPVLPTPAINLDEVMAVQEEPRTARLLLWLDGDSIHYSFMQQDDLEQPLAGEFKKITRTSLSDCLGRIQSILKPVSEHVIWNKLGYRIDAPQSDSENRAFWDFMERVATAGSILYDSLATDDDCRQLLEAINDLAPDSRLSISTDCAFLPWEILYPHRYNFEWPDATKAKFPLQVQDFWGYRFAIECLLKAKTTYKLPFRAHQTAQPFLSGNFNPTLDAIGGAAYKPVTDQESWIKQLDSRKYRTDVRKTGNDIKSMLFTPDYEATVIYLYCHGSNDKPLQESQSELLELDEGMRIGPNLLTDGSTFKNGPIVFLNSCSSGAFSPLAFSTFLTRFREKKALGLIATNFPVPAAFAAKFGWEIIEQYLQPPTKTLGDVLLQERRRLLDAKNPLGLFYSLQCPMGITARPIK